MPSYLTVGLIAVTALDVFFVLSGFLITAILIDAKGTPGYFRTFYIRRAVRILPLYYGFLLAYLIIAPRFAGIETGGSTLRPVEQLSYWSYWVNVAYALHWQLAAFTGHLWTLSVEEQFYLAWPVVVWACTRRQLRRVCLLCLLTAPLVRVAVAVLWPDTLLFYTFTPARMDGLALGALIAVVWRDPDATDQLRWLSRCARWACGLCVIITAAAIAVSPGLNLQSNTLNLAYFTTSVYCAGGLVIEMLHDTGRWWHRLVKSWPLRRVGMYSYAIYVLHDPLAYVVQQLGLLDRPGSGATPGTAMTYFLAMTTLSIAAGALSWHLLERPLLRLRPALSVASSRTRVDQTGVVNPPAPTPGAPG